MNNNPYDYYEKYHVYDYGWSRREKMKQENESSAQVQQTNIEPKDIPSLGQIQNLSFPFIGGADPITAGFNAAAAFFNFLSTIQGQRVTADILTLDEEFVKKLHDLFVKIHDYIQKKV